MIFKQIAVGPMQNFSYIIGDEKSKEAAVVDAGWDVGSLIRIADENKLKVTKIILTHYHYDHSQKINEIAERTNAEVYYHEDEEQFLRNTIKIEKSNIIKLKDNDFVMIGNLKVKVLHTPGHSPGSICLLAEKKLVTGDTLFVSAIGRTDLPGGNALQLFESLQKLKKLDDNVEVYPGHDYGDVPFSTIGREKKNNPYFMCSKKEEFLGLVG